MGGAIVGLLLAAGSSRRFGANKLIQPLPDGRSVAVHSCRNLLAGTGNVLAVVRQESGPLAACLRDEGAEVMEFAGADLGMGASLAFAVRSSAEAAGWLVALADMPWIRPMTVGLLVDAMGRGAALVAPVYQGRRGHPVGFSAVFRDRLISLSGDEGARSFLTEHAQVLTLREVDDPGILRDVDLPEDLRLHGRS